MSVDGDVGSGPGGPTSIGVCMYSPSSTGGGHWVYTCDLLEALAALPSDVKLRVCMATSDRLGERYRTGHYPVHAVFPAIKPKTEFSNRLQWACSRVVYYLRRDRAFLRWALRDREHEIVHVQDYWLWLAARHFRILRRGGKQVFCTVHNVEPHRRWSSWWDAVVGRVNRRAWRNCTALLVHADSLALRLSEALGGDHPPIHVTPHGVAAVEVVGPQRHDRSAAERNPRLLCFGALRSDKGIEILLEAMRELPECRLIIAGSPHERGLVPRLRDRIGRLPAEQVTLMDRFIPEAEAGRLFSSSDLVILPYTSFGAQSGVLHLAVAYRVPVVATEVGALGETVAEFELGEVVRPGDAAALAAGIRSMLDPRRHAHARAALPVAAERLAWAGTAALTLRAYLDPHGATADPGRGPLTGRAQNLYAAGHRMAGPRSLGGHTPAT